LLSPIEVGSLLSEARSLGATTYIDSRRLASLNADYIKTNPNEYKNLTQCHWAKSASQFYSSPPEIEGPAFTPYEETKVLYSHPASPQTLPAISGWYNPMPKYYPNLEPQKPIISRCGAGDVFLAAFADRKAKGFNDYGALIDAHTIAGESCTRPGTCRAHLKYAIY
jgi:sugar/nucleoside kinase (ribokinase family)